MFYEHFIAALLSFSFETQKRSFTTATNFNQLNFNYDHCQHPFSARPACLSVLIKPQTNAQSITRASNGMYCHTSIRLLLSAATAHRAVSTGSLVWCPAILLWSKLPHTRTCKRFLFKSTLLCPVRDLLDLLDISNNKSTRTLQFSIYPLRPLCQRSFNY